MIEIKAATVIKSGQPLFKNFTWLIRRGENWVLTGANGSGKTTLLEMLAGRLHIPSGEIIYDFVTGKTWEQRYQEKRNKICYIPAHAIHTLLSNSHDLYYQQRYYSVEDENTLKVRDILRGFEDIHANKKLPDFDISSLMDIDVTRLSNGQLKKVLILKRLMNPQLPELLLLDYPFEGLDVESRSDLCQFIDFVSIHYSIHVLLTDHHNHLPTVINRRLVLDRFQIVRSEDITAMCEGSDQNDFKVPTISATEEPVVEMKDVTIRYGSRTIIDNLNWTVRKGERWALTGKNGAGKTTLFSLIYADHPLAYTQKIFLFGRRRGTGESIWDIKKRITYFGPELISYLNPKGIFISGIDYIRNSQKYLDEAALDTLLHYFQAHDFQQLPVNRLSSGQLQVMLLISSFLTEKELLLLDEPFQFLDLRHKELVQHYLQSHLSPERTLILITHYEHDIAAWTNHVMHVGE